VGDLPITSREPWHTRRVTAQGTVDVECDLLRESAAERKGSGWAVEVQCVNSVLLETVGPGQG
jgi:hypothetical protein